MEIISGKWKPNLIWYIHSGVKRPADLHRRLPKASRRLLDSQLRQLSAQGIIHKTIFAQKTARVEYGLTALGQTLIPVIEVAARWGEKHREVLEPVIQQNL